MHKPKTLFTLVFLLAGIITFAQSNSKGKMSDRQIDQLNSERQIKQLKNGFLLVRLHTRQPLINALNANNRQEEAKQIEIEQRNKNVEIMKAFRLYFDFCPTYFFYSNDSEKIKQENTSAVTYVDSTGTRNEDIKLPNQTFYIAEFALVKKDTATFQDRPYLVETENGLEQHNRTEGGGNFGFEALVFKSPQFYQLRRPFPYYSRTLQSLPIFRRSFKRVIQRANEALHYYYNKVY